MDDDIPPSIIEKMPRRLVVIGDLHGDLYMAIKCLLKGNVIEVDGDKIAWIGGDSVVVQMGDQVDGCRPFMTRCNECDDDDPLEVDKCHDKNGKYSNPEDSEVRIMDLFDELHVEAQKDGGAVYCLLGNHEIMNVDGNLRYVSGKNLEHFKKYIDKNNGINNRCDARRYVFRTGNEFAKRLAKTRTTSLIIGDWMFLHGGITKDVIKQCGIKRKKDIIQMNELVRKWLNGEIAREKVEHIIGIIKRDDKNKNIENCNTVFWNRELGQLSESETKDTCDRLLNDVFGVLGIEHVVVGHTPQMNGCGEGKVNCTCDDRVCRVDVGMSEAFELAKKGKRKPQLLVVEKGDIKCIN